ncbi:RNA-directed DNA polymerase from mobile element jockey [Caerostris extrusa]|uniref:RNA-directed DNA polymerase from mobile element jockey n=1 Tax=Caerostris extrusa TaxID=172846 RepID=A0AAV4YFY9_CAEEX|nr:RNA-directed DNA polymerase from mobile element jockey [Caerostris extrusa]
MPEVPRETKAPAPVRNQAPTIAKRTARQPRVLPSPVTQLLHAMLEQGIYKVLSIRHLSQILSIGANVIVAGDFNARHSQWNVGNQNESGRILHRFIKNRIELKLIAPNVPTKVDFYKNVYSTLDLAIFKNIPFNYNINVLNELSSDHFPVIIELDTDISNLKLPQQLLTNWEDFRYLLQTKPLPPLNLSNPADADSALSNVVEAMQEALRNSSKPKFL